MTQQGPLPQANEEHKAFSSLNEKTQAGFPPLFKIYQRMRAPSSGVYLGETGSVLLLIQFLSFAFSDIRNADNSHCHVYPLI
jgi:hypothetical protein